MKCFVGVLAVALLSGCSTSPVPSGEAAPVPASRLFSHQKPGPELATLIVTRDKGFVGSGCNTTVSVDGVKSAAIGSGETAKFYLSAGDHIISASACGTGLKEREATLKAGGTKRFRISIDSAMSMDLSPTAY